MEGSELDENDEQVVSISEFMEGMEAQQLEADLVLGGDEGNECTFEKGYMKRQAVFSCLTCTPAGNAGFCTACSLLCHDGHEVVELWTRRGFRCDCGNEKFGVLECQLYKGKESQNKGNLYNQNYRGLYCSCHRPFPDPDRAEQGEMLQCCICEDWFHESHLGLSSSHQVPRDDDGEPSFDELVCPSCVDRCSFLSQYADLLVPPSEVDEDPPPPSDVEDPHPPSSSVVSKGDSEVLVRDPSLGVLTSRDSSGAEDPPPPSDVEKPPPPFSSVVSKDDSEVLVSNPSLEVVTSRDSSEASGSNRESSRSTKEEPTKVKLQALGKRNVETATGESSNGGVSVCKLKPSFHMGASQLVTNGVSTSEGVETEGGMQLKAGEAIFLAKSWRAELCRCDACLAMYAAKELGFLLDEEDTLQEYEETAKKKREECQLKQEGMASDFMKKLGHVQKIELLHGINNMSTELGSYLTSFGEAGKIVTSADIYEFFEKLQQKRRRLN